MPTASRCWDASDITSCAMSRVSTPSSARSRAARSMAWDNSASSLRSLIGARRAVRRLATSGVTSAAVDFPGARRPERTRRVSSAGLQLAVYEWGDEGDPPLLLAHGGFDFAGTFDVFAPLLAAGGWR